MDTDAKQPLQKTTKKENGPGPVVKLSSGAAARSRFEVKSDHHESGALSLSYLFIPLSDLCARKRVTFIQVAVGEN